MTFEPRYYHEILIEFDLKRVRIFEKAAGLYASGSSLRDVSHQLAILKSSVKDRLGPLELRRRTRVPTPPYGYLCVSGKLVEHPLEQEPRTVAKLQNLSQ